MVSPPRRGSDDTLSTHMSSVSFAVSNGNVFCWLYRVDGPSIRPQNAVLPVITWHSASSFPQLCWTLLSCSHSAIRYKYFLPLFTYFPLSSRSQCADKSVNFDNSARKLIPLSSKFLFFDLNFSVDLQARLRRIPGIFTKLLCVDTPDCR